MTTVIEGKSTGLTDEQKSILMVWQRVNSSLSAFYKLINSYKSAALALQKTPSSWAEIKIHAKHVQRHQDASEPIDNQFLADIEKRIAANKFQLLFQEDDEYPQQLKSLFYAPPVLFYRGDSSRLNQSQVAIVGSRTPTASAQKLTFDMAQYLAKAGYIVTSGLAQGVDTQAHLGALSQEPDSAGRTIGVMGTGIDVCYPKQNEALFGRIVAEGGCIVSELLPGTPPNKHTFPRRNRLVAGLSLGTIVTEAKIKSGSLITARLTSEQGKQVFAMPSTIDNSNAEGCHHLIREGATLIYHPEQVITDLSHQLVSPVQRQSLSQSLIAPIATTNNQQADTTFARAGSQNKRADRGFSMASNSNSHSESIPVVVPEHLQSLWMHLDFEGQDLDALIHKTQLATATLLSQLMELELMGVSIQVGGRYKRV